MFFPPLSSCSFDDQLSSNFHRLLFWACWDTQSEKTGLWQLSIVSSVFKANSTARFFLQWRFPFLSLSSVPKVPLTTKKHVCASFKKVLLKAWQCDQPALTFNFEESSTLEIFTVTSFALVASPCTLTKFLTYAWICQWVYRVVGCRGQGLDPEMSFPK